MPMTTPTPRPRSRVLVPVKPPAFAKSRLATLGDAARRDLAAAFAVDTVDRRAGVRRRRRGCPRGDRRPRAGARAAPTSASTVIPDGTTDDLNGTLVLAAAEMHRRRPDLRLVALCADLPALRPDELARALPRPRRPAMSFVADADGVGTTAVVARGPRRLPARRSGPARARRTSTPARTEIDAVDVPTAAPRRRRPRRPRRRARGSASARARRGRRPTRLVA